jgi:hypothetical protein
MLLAEIERRLNAALQAQEDAENQMSILAAEKDRNIQNLERSGMDREKAHGNALALRDARISEFRREIDHLNEALAAAYSNELASGKEIELLKDEVKAVKKSAQEKIATVQEQIYRMMQAHIESPSIQSSPQRPDIGTRRSAGETSTELRPVVRRGRYLDASLARRGSSKGKRRYDSGLDFLEEEEEREQESGDVDTTEEPVGV